MSTHAFSIVAIRDTFESPSNRFLLYYDARWQCDFFLNYRTQTDEKQNREFIKQCLSEQLNVDAENIQLEYSIEATYRKFSVSDQCEKHYDHRLYQATIENFPEVMKADRFTINGIQYRWATLEDMKNDPDIRAKNAELVKLVEESIF